MRFTIAFHDNVQGRRQALCSMKTLVTGRNHSQEVLSYITIKEMFTDTEHTNIELECLVSFYPVLSVTEELFSPCYLRHILKHAKHFVSLSFTFRQN